MPGTDAGDFQQGLGAEAAGKHIVMLMLHYEIRKMANELKLQGLWMGILTSAGSFARFVGPIFVTSIYNKFGPYLTIGIVVISLALALLSSIIFYRRLVPLKAVDESIEMRELDDPAEKSDKESTTAL